MTKPEIEAFLAVTQYGSISAASDKLFVTQPALSRRIRSLEEELGYELFERGRGIRNVKLTEQGCDFIALAERFLRLYREAEELPEKRRKPILRVSAVNSLASYLLPGVISRLMEGDDPCAVEFKSGHNLDFYGYVENKAVDVALVTDVVPSKKVLTFPAFEEPYVFAGGERWRGMEMVSPSLLDPGKQLFMPWNPEYEVWHRKWFDPDCIPELLSDRMEFLEGFLREDRWAVVPLLVADRLKKKGIWTCPLRQGPMDHVIYCLLADEKKDRLTERFLRLVHEELSKVEGIRSYLDFSQKENPPG